MNHNKVYYSSFRKNFYVEVPELARMTSEGKNWFLRAQLSLKEMTLLYLSLAVFMAKN